MSKEYFPHDYGARSSLRGIRKDYGLQGIGFYWCFVEILHEEGGYIKESDLDDVAYDLQVEPELCQAITHNYGLFAIKKGKIFSERVLRNIKKRAEISAARKRAANGRWGAPPPEEPPAQQDRQEQGAAPIDEEVRKDESDDAIDEDYEECVAFYKDQVVMRCEFWEEEIRKKGALASDLFSSPPSIIKSRLTGLIDLIKGKKQQKINGQMVSTEEFLSSLIEFFTDRDKTWSLYSLLLEVDEKAEHKEIKNKQNYLVAALYNAAKTYGA